MTTYDDNDGIFTANLIFIPSFLCQMNDEVHLSSPDENHQLVLTVEGKSRTVRDNYNQPKKRCI